MMSALNRALRPAAAHPASPATRPLAGACLALLVACMVWQPAQAQSPGTLVVEPVIEDQELLASPEADAPSRVARLGYLAGDIDIAPAGSEAWAEAVLNRPLTSGDRLWVPAGGRAELQIASTVVSLDGATRFGFITLDDDLLQASLTQGVATVRVRRLAAGEALQIETPHATVVLREAGEYHLEVDPDGRQTIVKTRSGLAEAHGTREVHRVVSGQMAQLSGLEPLYVNMAALSEHTPFEDWANQRDARATQSQSAQYVAEDVIGYEDLDEHGQWHHEAEYGHVWQPRQVAVDWAPYRDGRWGWVAPWGWTWIDVHHWGFAPFHYGRWVQIRQRWSWVPGPRHHRAVYAPALVGWVGSAPVSVGVSIGNIGWYPLGPHDVYRPGYRYSLQYIQRINISNSLFITQRHFHRGIPAWSRFDARRHHHGFTAVRHELFVGSHLLRGNHLRMDHQGLRHWHAHSRAPIIAPYRESVLIGRQRPGPRHDLRQRDFVAGRIPFHRERHAIEANGGRPLDRLQLRGGAARDRDDFMTHRRQLQREFGLRNTGNAGFAGSARDQSRNPGSRLIREDRQGFNPPPRRLDEGPRGRTSRDANGERLQIIRAEENRRRAQQDEPRQYQPPRNSLSPEDRQRWREQPSREPGREQWRNNGSEQRGQGSSRFITQPGQQRETRPDRPARNELRDRQPPRVTPQPQQQRNAQPNRPVRGEQRERTPPRATTAPQQPRSAQPNRPTRGEQRDGSSSRFVTQPRQRDAQSDRPARNEQRAQPRAPAPQRSDNGSGAKRHASPPWNGGKQ